MKKKVVAYVRFNSEVGYNEQIAYISKYINSNNLILKHIYSDENCSGRNTNRPAFQQMIREIERDNDLEAVIVSSISKFFRNLADLGFYLKRFEAKNIDFISINEALFQLKNGSAISSLKSNLICALGELQNRCPTIKTEI